MQKVFNMNEEAVNKFWELSLNQTFMIPSYFDYPVYDDFCYQYMCQDKIRMNSYQTVINKTVKNKKVVEIGTGATFPLAQMCVEAGAEIIYAIESDKSAAQKAINLISKKGLSDRIKVIIGDSSEVELPEKVDVCLSEIIGGIGSSEGAIAVLKDSKRFLKEETGIMIPARCVTQIAPVSLPDNLYQDEFLEEIINYHNHAFYQVKGYEHKFTRFLFHNLPESHFLASSQVFEDIQFDGCLEPNFSRSLFFPISSEGTFHGFLLWINLYVDSATMINALKDATNWATIYIPNQGATQVRSGDVIQIDGTVRLSKNGINPDYIIKGGVFRNNDKIHDIEINSLY